LGVRIRLDGEVVYENGPTAQPGQVVEVERPYARGSHRIEFEIVEASNVAAPTRRT
jgi:hypothetical protein